MLGTPRPTLSPFGTRSGSGNPDALSPLPGDACRHNARAIPCFSRTAITTCSRGAACNFKRNQSTDSPRSRAMIVRSVVEKNQSFSGRILCLSVFLSLVFCLSVFILCRPAFLPVPKPSDRRGALQLILAALPHHLFVHNLFLP